MMYKRAAALFIEQHNMNELILEETQIKSFYLWIKKLKREKEI